MIKRSLAWTTLLTLTLTAVPADASPDRCATLGSDGYPALCEPIAEDLAWFWGGEVCCEGASCTLSSDGSCPAATDAFSCRYARVDALGHATCQFPIPRYCDIYECQPASAMPTELPPLYTWGPQESAVCCFAEVGCYAPEGGPCGGYLTWCDDGVTEDSGLVTCFDEDWEW